MRIILKIILCIAPFLVNSQVKFSFATDASLLRNFDGKQPFTVFGQSIHAQWHMDDLSTIYSFLTYHLDGKYKSKLVAMAKQPSTVPATINFTNSSAMRLRQISIGLKRYFAGTYKTLESFNIYALGGFGLIIGSATNNFSSAIDTTQYLVQNNIINGTGKFKRLSFDLGLGFEVPVGYELFLFSEVRIHIPTSEYPSNYLLKNNNAPLLGSINLGVRLLFNDEE